MRNGSLQSNDFFEKAVISHSISLKYLGLGVFYKASESNKFVQQGRFFLYELWWPIETKFQIFYFIGLYMFGYSKVKIWSFWQYQRCPVPSMTKWGCCAVLTPTGQSIYQGARSQGIWPISESGWPGQRFREKKKWDFETFCPTQNTNVHRFTLKLHGLKIIL